MITNDKIKISVLMPAYNADRYISEAIESILNQTFTEFEFIIVDDCSTDNTWGIIQEYAKKDVRIVPLKNSRNLKICESLNVGLHITKGKYIVRMDADDWSFADRIEKQFNYMESNPDIGISGGSMLVCDENLKQNGIRRYKLTDIEIRKKLFKYSPYSHPTVIFRKSILDKLDLAYNTSLVTAEDYDIYFRIGQYSKFGNLKDVLVKYRVISTSISQQKGSTQENNTLYIRIKAVMEYGYKMSPSDKTYFLLQCISTYVIPFKIKFMIFNFLRNNRK